MDIVNNKHSLLALARAARNCEKAVKAHDKARDKYTGYSWGYAGQDYIHAMEETALEYGKLLDEFIDTRVRSILEGK